MKNNIEELKIGDRVRTRKGCKLAGPSSGIIVGWSKWNGISAANVKKDAGDTRQFLIRNLYKI